MIEYTNSGSGWLLGQVFRIEGSVLHKAIGYATCNAVIAGVLHFLLVHFSVKQESSQMMDGVPVIWTGYTSILGFLVVFRNNQAYARFWEGATLVRQIRGEWFNAISALMAFTNTAGKNQALQQDCLNYRELLVRLASTLHCSALRQVCELDENALHVLDLSEIEPESVKLLSDSHDRCQLIIYWLQGLIIQAQNKGVIDVPSPILSRVFQELSRGMVGLSNLHKIKEIPFPYPYQQMLLVMLLIHNVITSAMAALIVDSIYFACAMAFMVTGSFWAVIYIAVEIDQPFGDDPNDLPLIEMQEEFNQDLVSLLKSSTAPLPSLVKHQEGADLEFEIKGRTRKRADTTPLINVDWSKISEAQSASDGESTVANGQDKLETRANGQEPAEEHASKSASRPPLPPELDAAIVSGLMRSGSNASMTSSKSLNGHGLPDEEPARIRVARYLQELAGTLNEEDADLDTVDMFVRGVSGPQSPSQGIVRRKKRRHSTSSNQHFGTSTDLQATRSFKSLEEPSSLAKSFEQAKLRLEEKDAKDLTACPIIAQEGSEPFSPPKSEQVRLMMGGGGQTAPPTASRDRILGHGDETEIHAGL